MIPPQIKKNRQSLDDKSVSMYDNINVIYSKFLLNKSNKDDFSADWDMVENTSKSKSTSTSIKRPSP